MHIADDPELARASENTAVGAVATRDLPANVVAVVSPARVLRRL